MLYMLKEMERKEIESLTSRRLEYETTAQILDVLDAKRALYP